MISKEIKRIQKTMCVQSKNDYCKPNKNLGKFPGLFSHKQIFRDSNFFLFYMEFAVQYYLQGGLVQPIQIPDGDVT